MPSSSIHSHESLITAIQDLTRHAEEVGLEPIPHEVLQSAIRIVRSLPADLLKAPKFVPMSKGRLQLEWHDGPRTLEIEFKSPKEIHYLKWDSSIGVEEEDVIAIDAQASTKVAELIEWFCGTCRSVYSERHGAKEEGEQLADEAWLREILSSFGWEPFGEALMCSYTQGNMMVKWIHGDFANTVSWVLRSERTEAEYGHGGIVDLPTPTTRRQVRLLIEALSPRKEGE